MILSIDTLGEYTYGVLVECIYLVIFNTEYVETIVLEGFYIWVKVIMRIFLPINTMMI
jgi:hypothetical protein